MENDKKDVGPGGSGGMKGRPGLGIVLLEWLRMVGRAARYYARGLYNRGDDDHIFLLAGGLSFSLLVCIIPFMLILFSAAGVILEKPSIAQELNDYIDAAIPYPEYADTVKELVFERIMEFKVYKTVAGLIGLVGLFFASSGLFSSMRTILNLVFRTASNISMLASKLRDFVLVLAVLLYFLVSTAVLPSLEVIGNLAVQIPFLKDLDLTVVDDLVLETVGFVAILGGFSILYAFVPSQKIPRRVVLISAAATALLWEVAKNLFGIYLANAVTLQRVYGAYMFLIAVVFWIYYSSVVFIVGAEIGQLYRERSQAPNHA